MRPRIGGLVLAGACATILGACANETTSAGPGEEASTEPRAAEVPRPDSAEEFTHLLSGGAYVDYKPLPSAAEALEFADVIVTGTIVDVVSAGSNRVLIEVEVDDTLHGTRPDGDVLDITHEFKGSVAGTEGPVEVSVEELAESGIGLDVVAVAEDVTDVADKAETSAGKPVSMVAIDGFWLEGSRDPHMHGVYVEARDVPEPWGPVRTIEQFAGAIRDEVAASSSSP